MLILLVLALRGNPARPVPINLPAKAGALFNSELNWRLLNCNLSLQTRGDLLTSKQFDVVKGQEFLGKSAVGSDCALLGHHFSVPGGWGYALKS
jgi:hypothetical protein